MPNREKSMYICTTSSITPHAEENVRKRRPYNNTSSASTHSRSEEDNTFESREDIETYNTMKEKLLLHQPPLTVERKHLTERDVLNSFQDESPQKKNFSSQTKDTAKFIGQQYCQAWGGWLRLFRKIIPITDVLCTYKMSYIASDLAAGLSVGVISIPMGMSYALLAGLPAAYGLYNNIFFPLFYMFFGTGRQVCVGTSAIEALMAAEATAKIVGWDAPFPVFLNTQMSLAFFVGLMLIMMRLLRLGLVACFLADPVLSGFATGSVITIATSQLKYAFGLKIPRLKTPQTWWYIITHLNEANWGCFVISVTGILFLVVSKIVNDRWFKKCPLPGAFFMLLIFTALSYIMRLDSAPYNIPVVGTITAGIPSPTFFALNSALILPLLQQAFWYSLVYFVIHISIGKTIAQEKHYVLDANQEFLACGISSVLGSFFQCFPIATSVSRSSVANIMGAQTILYSIPNIAVVASTTTIITPLLRVLPMPALAAVVLFGVYWMMHFKEAYILLKLWSPDFLLWIVCFSVTVIWGAMEGVVAGVTLSLLWILKKNAFPTITILGQLPGTMIYRNIDRFSVAQEIPGCKIIRFDASLNFSNADRFEGMIIRSAHLEAHEHNLFKSQEKTINDLKPIKVVIIDASSINDMDISSIRMLKSVAKRMKDNSRILLFANWRGPMRDFLDKTKLYNVVPPEHCFLCLHDAVLWARTFYLFDDDINYDNTIYDDDKTTHTESPVSPECQCTGRSDETRVDLNHGARLVMRFVTESVENGQREWPVVTSTPHHLYQ